MVCCSIMVKEKTGWILRLNYFHYDVCYSSIIYILFEKDTVLNKTTSTQL